jgi:hypothetical protein
LGSYLCLRIFIASELQPKQAAILIFLVCPHQISLVTSKAPWFVQESFAPTCMMFCRVWSCFMFFSYARQGCTFVAQGSSRIIPDLTEHSAIHRAFTDTELPPIYTTTRTHTKRETLARTPCKHTRACARRYCCSATSHNYNHNHSHLVLHCMFWPRPTM